MFCLYAAVALIVSGMSACEGSIPSVPTVDEQFTVSLLEFANVNDTAPLQETIVFDIQAKRSHM